MARLADLKPDIVKRDRSVVRDCDLDPIRLAIVARMIDLGADTGIKVVIEGVERASELEALRSIGARSIQGFYFARPKLEGIDSDADVFSGPETEAAHRGPVSEHG